MSKKVEDNELEDVSLDTMLTDFGLDDDDSSGNKDDETKDDDENKDDTVEDKNKDKDSDDNDSSDDDSNKDDDTDKEQELRDKIIEKYNGAGFDDDGNLVDNNGQVIKSIDDLEKEFGGEVQDDNSVNELINLTGIKINNAEGVEKEYANSDDGIKEYIEDIQIAAKEQAAQELFNNVPGLYDAYLTLSTGGSLDNLSGQTDWSKVDLQKEDTKQHISVIAADLIDEGMSKERAEAVAKTLAETEDSFAEAKKSRDALVQRKTERDKETQKQIDEQNKARADKIKQHWSNVKKTIDKGVVKTSMGELTIPKNKREEFYKYRALSADETNASQAAIDYNNLSDNDRMLIEYMLFSKFNFNDLISQKAGSTKIKGLRKILGKTKNIDHTEDVGKDLKDEEISLDNLI